VINCLNEHKKSIAARLLPACPLPTSIPSHPAPHITRVQLAPTASHSRNPLSVRLPATRPPPAASQFSKSSPAVRTAGEGARPLAARCRLPQFQKGGKNGPAPKAGRERGRIGVGGVDGGRGVTRSNLRMILRVRARSLHAAAFPSSKKGGKWAPLPKRAASGAVSGSAASTVGEGHEEQPEA
jgi:hypothetical protein